MDEISINLNDSIPSDFERISRWLFTGEVYLAFHFQKPTTRVQFEFELYYSDYARLKIDPRWWERHSEGWVCNQPLYFKQCQDEDYDQLATYFTLGKEGTGPGWIVTGATIRPPVPVSKGITPGLIRYGLTVRTVIEE